MPFPSFFFDVLTNKHQRPEKYGIREGLKVEGDGLPAALTWRDPQSGHTLWSEYTCECT